MELTHELLLPYQGLDTFEGLCHIRVYEQPGSLPVVIAGGLDEHPGISITNAIEMLATTIKRSLFSDGREFHMIEHHRDGIDDRPAPTYSLIHFSHRPLQEHPDERDNIEGDFRHPYWEPIDDIEHLDRVGDRGARVVIQSAGDHDRQSPGLFVDTDVTESVEAVEALVGQ